jgi:ankyrin repeat protein
MFLAKFEKFLKIRPYLLWVSKVILFAVDSAFTFIALALFVYFELYGWDRNGDTRAVRLFWLLFLICVLVNITFGWLLALKTVKPSTQFIPIPESHSVSFRSNARSMANAVFLGLCGAAILSVIFCSTQRDLIREHRARGFTNAAWHGELWKMKLLSMVGAKANTFGPGNGLPIVAASSEGQMKVIEYLLEKGADVNQKDKFGWTALIWAADNGHAETVRYLISHGADVNAVGEDGSALRRAIDGNHLEVIRILRDRSARDCYGYELNDCK